MAARQAAIPRSQLPINSNPLADEEQAMPAEEIPEEVDPVDDILDDWDDGYDEFEDSPAAPEEAANENGR